MSTKALTENQIMIRYLELSDELGYHQNTIRWVHYAVKILSERKNGNSGNDQPSHITAKELCTTLIKDANQLYDESIQKTLQDLKLLSSKDIGKIIYGLADNKLVTTGPNDSITDYDNIFSMDNLDAFLSEAGIIQQTSRCYWWYRSVMWTFYIVGTAIVVASYGNIVSSHIAWIGWIIAMCGFLMQFVKRPEKKRF